MGKEKEHSEIWERMMQVCEYIKVSPNKLSLDMGKSRDYIRQLGPYITSDCLQYIHRNYPQLNLIWIITGEGSIETEKNANNEEKNNLTILLRLYEQERELNMKLSKEINNLREK